MTKPAPYLFLSFGNLFPKNVSGALLVATLRPVCANISGTYFQKDLSDALRIVCFSSDTGICMPLLMSNQTGSNSKKNKLA